MNIEQRNCRQQTITMLIKTPRELDLTKSRQTRIRAPRFNKCFSFRVENIPFGRNQHLSCSNSRGLIKIVSQGTKITSQGKKVLDDSHTSGNDRVLTSFD